MKTRIRNTALMAALLLAGATFAQDKPAGSPPPRPATEQNIQEAKLDVPAVAKELELDAAQVAKVKEIEAKTEAELTATKDLQGAEKASKVNGIIAERNKAIAGVLTPAQSTKWQELQKANVSKTKAVAPKAQPVEQDNE